MSFVVFFLAEGKAPAHCPWGEPCGGLQVALLGKQVQRYYEGITESTFIFLLEGWR